MEKINIKLKIWRQKNSKAKGAFKTYKIKDIDTSMSFLEMLDRVNDDLTQKGLDPIAFDHHCREGVCGSCGAVVNGQPNGPQKSTTICQLRMNSFKNNDTIFVEPFRAKAFPVIKDLIIDRTAIDRITAAGDFLPVDIEKIPEANAQTVPHEKTDMASDAASCISCGACVAACPNTSIALYVGARMGHLSDVSTGNNQQNHHGMIEQMDKEGFGCCSNTYVCKIVCPKDIDVSHIARMNKKHFSK